MAMYRFLLICLGGAIGTGARYLIAIGAPRLLGTSFPYATLTVNVVGSFLLGAVMHVGLTNHLMTPGLRLVLTTGVMGGFTTYSTFNYETIEYLREGALGLAGLNVAATVLLCLVAGAVGPARAVQDLPLVIEVVDTEEHVKQLEPILDEMVADGLVTLEKVRVLKYKPGTPRT